MNCLTIQRAKCLCLQCISALWTEHVSAQSNHTATVQQQPPKRWTLNWLSGSLFLNSRTTYLICPWHICSKKWMKLIHMNVQLELSHCINKIDKSVIDETALEITIQESLCTSIMLFKCHLHKKNIWIVRELIWKSDFCVRSSNCGDNLLHFAKVKAFSSLLRWRQQCFTCVAHASPLPQHNTADVL